MTLLLIFVFVLRMIVNGFWLWLNKQTTCFMYSYIYRVYIDLCIDKFVCCCLNIDIYIKVFSEQTFPYSIVSQIYGFVKS